MMSQHQPLLELPQKLPTQSLELSKALTSALVALSDQEQTDLGIILLAVLKVLLHRYTGQEEVLVVSPPSYGCGLFDGSIKPVTDLVAVRTSLGDNPSFRELLVRVREANQSSWIAPKGYSDLSAEDGTSGLASTQNGGRLSDLQVMFSFQADTKLRLQTSYRNTGFDHNCSNIPIAFDLNLSITSGEQGLTGTVEYNPVLFDSATITRMMGHFRTLLSSVAAAPEQQVSAVSLLTAEEYNQMLIDWNSTQADFPKDKCIHQLFEEQAERLPNAHAVVFADSCLTYKELNERSNQLAHYLQGIGVGPDVLVALCVERSLEMIVGILGIHKAGGAYVPLDPEFPQERLAFMLDDMQASILLTQQHLVKHLPSHQAKVICLDADWGVIDVESKASPSSSVVSTNLAYAMYTSGSTGRPKGVLIQHQGLCSVMLTSIASFGINDSDRILQFATFSFDVSVWEIFAALISGASLYLIDRESMLSDHHLLRLIRERALTTVFLLPSVLKRLSAENLPALRRVITGGEGFAQDFITRWSQERHFFYVYGPTEATILQSFIDCSESCPDKPLLGRVMANFQYYVLDSHLQPVPVGVSGELHIGGVGLARGYLNQPELSQQKFIANPFSDEPGARLYKTGDLVRYLPDGNLEFLGRSDHQLKIRGIRIELGEIEVVLAQHPDVREVVVISREDVPGDKRLVAYVVPLSEHRVSISQLKNFLKQRLPEYMIPSAFVLLDELPLLPNKKINRHALPAPPQTRPDLEEAFVAPRTLIEITLADLWAEVLNLEKVGIRDDFFELGGHSQLASQVISQMCEAFGMDIPLRALFETPTIAELAAVIAQGNN